MSSWRLPTLLALSLSLLATPSLADGREPGSVLVYPIHRSGLGFTVVSVTNTNTTPAVFGTPGGTTNVLYQYVNTVPDPTGSPVALDCYVVDRLETLTPADTLSVLTSCHNAATAEGYLVVAATSLFTGIGKDAISFNHLVGSQLVINATGGFYSVNAIPFASPLGEGLATDLDGDGQYDFDGFEYEGVAEELYGEFLAIAGSSLTLINLTGGTRFDAVASFDVWNDNEQPLSATKLFRCWIEEPLPGISPIFTDGYLANNTPHDPHEVDVDCDGVGDLEAGWARIRGNVASSSAETIANPAFLGAITAGSGIAPPGTVPAINGGRLLWESAEKQINGAFLDFGTTISEAPIITSDGGGATAAVSAAEGTTAVTDVDSIDGDGDSEGAGLVYSLTTVAGGGADNGLFTLSPVTGVLTFTSAPDFESPSDADTDNDYEVQVTVTDSDGMTDVQDITVTVTDVNESPVITSDGGGATASVSAAENQTAVTDVNSTDPEGETEGGGGLTYSLTTTAGGGADNGFFTLDPSTGLLTFTSAPDFDSPSDANTDNDYEVQVTVTDSGGATDVQDITVTVTDLNESPAITSDGGGATASVFAAENQTSVTDVDSTDPEDAEGSGLTYSLTTTAGGGADNGFFTLNPSTGLIAFTSAPDFENPLDADTDNDYEVQVTVTDSGGLTDVQDITVTVNNVNESPVITSDGGGATASVSAAENQTAVTDVNSADPEGETEGGGGLTYGLTTTAGGGVDNGFFTLNASTGVLTFTAAPDFESPADANTDNDYEVQVTVTDSGGATDVQDITVTVTDVNESPAITSDGGGPTASVFAAENQTSVTDVDSTDAEDSEGGGGLTYSFTTTAGGGADNGFFTLNPSTGLITFTSAPDFENPLDADTDNDYEVQVTVTDSGGLTDVQDITVRVTNVNESPVITSDGGGATASVSAAENQTAVTDVNSADPEGETEGAGLTYSLTTTAGGGVDNGFFTLNASTGLLTFTSAPDFESPADANTDNDYEVQITVTDSGGATDVQDITVTVTDVNELPAITSDGGGPTAIVNAAENQTSVTDADSTDPEDAEGAGLTYSLTTTAGGGADNGFFTLNPSTGLITFTSAPDFENPLDADTDNDYEVQVTVTDSGGLTDLQDITVTVNNVNESPVITSDGGGATAAVSVDETTTAVTDVNSADPEGETEGGGGLSYSLTTVAGGGVDNGEFTLNASTGDLTFTTAPLFTSPTDADTNNIYEVQVTVTDSGGATDVQDIMVTVNDLSLD